MIRVEGVSKRFGDVQALEEVSLVAAPGEVLGLLGPNGAGKTTLVRLLATLLRPDAGRVLLGGHDAAEDPASVRSLIGLAGQMAAVDELLTGRENLELVGRLYGLRGSDLRERSVAVLDQVDLADVGDRRVGTYSGGMRRRLDLAATLVGRPSVLLLDEPTAGLDPRSRVEVWDHVRSLAAAGTTVVLTSQHMDEVEQLAHRIVVLDHGRVIAVGTPDELKRQVGADVLEARVADEADLPVVHEVLVSCGDGPAQVETDLRRVTVPTRSSVAALVGAGQRLETRASPSTTSGSAVRRSTTSSSRSPVAPGRPPRSRPCRGRRSGPRSRSTAVGVRWATRSPSPAAPCGTCSARRSSCSSRSCSRSCSW